MLRSALRPFKQVPVEEQSQQASSPSGLQKRITPYIQSISTRASLHPINTIAFVALLASTIYIALLESSLFDLPASSKAAAGQVDIPSLLAGSKTLYLSQDTSWKWQNGDSDAYRDAVGVLDSCRY